MLVIAGQRRRDVVAVEQDARRARVLGGDQTHLAQHPQRAQGDVFEIADGRGDDVEGGHGGSIAEHEFQISPITENEGACLTLRCRIIVGKSYH